MIFSHFLVRTGVTVYVADLVSGSGMNRYVAVLLVAVILFIAGALMPAAAMILLFTPLFHPILVGTYGFDSIWLGVFIVIMVEMACITPPVGMHLFVFKGLVKEEISTKQLWQGVLPFVLADFTRLVVLTAFPIIATWLPYLIM